jgi:two-component system chemotaxis sensor kinase CheA
VNDHEEDEEIIQAFLEESRENLDQLDRDLVALETRPGDVALLAQVYRTIHTIKGTCGFLGYRRLEALTHVGENLLDALRSGAVALDRPTTSLLLALVDAVRVVLGRIESTRTEGEDPHAELIKALAAHADGSATGESPETDVTPPAAPDVPPSAPSPSTRGGEIPPAAEVTGQSTASLPSPPAGRNPAASAAVESSVRVDVAILDKLMDLVGELVLTRNRIGASVVDGDSALSLPYRQLRLVTAELQDSVLQARLQAVGTVTGKFHRIARDLAASLGKQVHVEVEGEDIAVDKAVNEALKDPLLHLVRNAVDHGLEGPVERIAAGKHPEGRLGIRTFHEGGLVHLEVWDDGRGIDPDRLRSSAVRAGLLSAEAAAALDRGQTLELMFRAGLSTTERVTNISGRGVGLDVVRSQLDQVGGSLEVTSDLGLGTRFRINVPLTLAILTAVMVRSGGQWFALGQVHVQEVVHLSADAARTSVTDILGARVLRRRDQLIPLVELADQLGMARCAGAVTDDGLDVVVVDAEGRHFGVVVDAVGESIEAVVKPLTRSTRHIPVFAGVTILGDGRPSLIVDLGGLATAAGLATIMETATRTEPSERDHDLSRTGDDSGLLLASAAGGEWFAMPLSTVVRLESFERDRVEHRGAAQVIQYGGAALPLWRMADLLRSPGDDESTNRSAQLTLWPGHGDLQTIVCRSRAGQIGFVVDRIEDVVSGPANRAGPSSESNLRRGVAGRFVLQDRVTELLDVEMLAADAGLRLSVLA